jgi:hypothetical protein
MEVAARENTDIRSGVVVIVWQKDMTIGDYDHALYARVANFDTKCWPVKRIACHTCCSPSIVVKVVKPILYALMDRHARSRFQLHDVPESQILDVLSGYGIVKDILPTEMGGTVRLNQSEWIAKRRAAELEEI